MLHGFTPPHRYLHYLTWHEIAKLPLEAQPELHLRPNKLARYEVVAKVMAMVQRLGLTKFGIVGSEQFIE